MKKKFLAMLLCISCALGCAFGFTACGGGDDNTGDGGDKTEQSGTPAKPDDKGEDKTEQTEKPEGNGDKTDDKTDDKIDDGDKTGDDEEKKDDSKNDFQKIIDALQAKLDDEYGEGAKILTIYPYVSGRRNYLGLKIKYGNAIKELETSALINTSWLDKNNNITDANQAVRLITNSTFEEATQNEFVGKYFTDNNDIIAEKMIEARVGTDYDIICAAVSDTTEATHDRLTNPVQFKVYALIAENDGKVYEFTETLVTAGTGNAYDTVINENRGNFESKEQTKTELGALADNYYSVMQKK